MHSGKFFFPLGTTGNHRTACDGRFNWTFIVFADLEVLTMSTAKRMVKKRSCHSPVGRTHLFFKDWSLNVCKWRVWEDSAGSLKVVTLESLWLQNDETVVSKERERDEPQSCQVRQLDRAPFTSQTPGGVIHGEGTLRRPWLGFWVRTLPRSYFSGLVLNYHQNRFTITHIMLFYLNVSIFVCVCVCVCV